MPSERVVALVVVHKASKIQMNLLHLQCYLNQHQIYALSIGDLDMFMIVHGETVNVSKDVQGWGSYGHINNPTVYGWSFRNV